MINQQEFEDYVISCYPQEACGVLQNNTFIALDNEHPAPQDNFLFDESVTLNLLQSKEPYKVIHSHTMEETKKDPRIPSYNDMKGQIACGVEWGIVHCDGENVSPILWFGLPKEDELIGRKYIPNVYDCFTLARDAIWQFFNKDIGDIARPENWEKENSYLLEQNYKGYNFKDICECSGLKKGDILLFNIGSQQPNHIGVFIEGDNFIHHLENRLSCVDSINKWRKQLNKIVRYQYAS